MRVLLVDDDALMRATLRYALSGEGFEVVGEAANGHDGAELVRTLRPDVALIDISMPVQDGIGMLRALRAGGDAVRALVLTSNLDQASISAAIEAGADGYVLKGSHAEEIRAALRDVHDGGSALTPRIARSVLDDYAKILEDRRSRDLAIITTLAGAVEARDQGTGDHARNVTRLSTSLWRLMMPSEPGEDLHYGFLLHDVGKISVPDAVLLKPGALDLEEVVTMRGHVDIGVRLVEPLGFKPYVTEVIACHHERYDGSGYPNGLRGEEIPLSARMFAVVDAYDAMTRDRPYRRAMPPIDAIAEIRRCVGTYFDPLCANAFAQMAHEDGLL